MNGEAEPPSGSTDPTPAVLLEVALTGGIASGKSTVDRMLEMSGARIIDADDLVHRLLQPDRPEHAAVVERFGREILAADGTVNRASLAQIIFADAAARADLNAIVHPGVGWEEEQMKAEIRKGDDCIVVTDAALIVETGRYQRYDRLVVVACEPALQLSRLLAREPHMTSAQAEARMHAQAPLETKTAVADYIIDTSGSLSDTERHTRRLYLCLHEDLELKRRGEPLPPRIGADPS